ncbi:hypothetical protein SEA_KABOCHA_71 [Gordonia phage Kabocha]|uniref:Uncharacterized protein n=2 Tax=Chidieberevirus TaxID=3044687 RepID=A0A649VL24_9CAUD|nr:hypothetical protein PQD14_gp070 [Gordonia phage Chidiebere]YP_010675713.1 hypothetical protein PQD15_gp066 [Gordonia phage ChisanaKitsune]AZS07923.1 hypothetical protein PBI_GRAY_70 [Gordonia phage Gray]WAA19857.1 hypothetical protein SEA_KABOCHA_71 [Gordonia phage Kabocha]WAA20046.1 hypothetical protein SEA_HANEM_69 [Gordonia phage Hanem]WNM67089.1 hypothetical protein SEA_SCHOMBER_68 [Gordonia Phage Schomber]QGJ92961.1 hypothetical protein PBI_CHIDIEBERE_70 [Gordonia phage Chidiebere]
MSIEAFGDRVFEPGKYAVRLQYVWRTGKKKGEVSSTETNYYRLFAPHTSEQFHAMVERPGAKRVGLYTTNCIKVRKARESEGKNRIVHGQ